MKINNLIVAKQKMQKYLYNIKSYLTLQSQILLFTVVLVRVHSIKDNTPSRLAVMQHTWEVFSFYTTSSSLLNHYNENL